MEKHMHLSKHESSALTQIRTGAIGLRAFLARRGVPGVNTPLCRCATEPETAAHLIARCPELAEARESLRSKVAPMVLRTERDVADLMGDPVCAGIVTRWMIAQDCFPTYILAREYTRLEREEDGAIQQRELEKKRKEERNKRKRQPRIHPRPMLVRAEGREEPSAPLLASPS